jgi:rRNA-processing protein FCF1
MPPDNYFDVAPSLTGGFRVICIARGQSIQQAIFDTPRDVAAAARILGAAVVSSDDDIRQACRAAGVRLVVMEERR